MYGAVASWMARVSVRLYCQWGMVYVTMDGIKRLVFENIDVWYVDYLLMCNRTVKEI